MSDIFPGVSIPNVDYMDINLAMTDFMNENNYQPIAIAMTKVNHIITFVILMYLLKFLGYSTVRNKEFKTFRNDPR